MKFLRILPAAILFLLPSCGTDQEAVSAQEDKITSWLQSKRIIDYTVSGGLYKYVPNSGRSSYHTDAEAADGDSVYYRFEAHIFASAPGELYYTNKPAIINSNPTINTTYWPLDRLGAKVGSTKMIDGLRRGLPGCRQGDSVVMVMTSDAAYGSDDVGVVPRNSAIIMMLDIVSVIKQP